MKTKKELDVSENPLYHDTWTLLRKYRDVVWSLELSVQRVRRQFQVEYGSSIEDFLESIYIAGVDFNDTGIEEQAKCIERSHKMLKLVDASVNLLREKHKTERIIIGSYFTVFSLPNRVRRQRQSSNSFNRIFPRSAIGPTIANVRKPSMLFHRSCGATLPRTA